MIIFSFIIIIMNKNICQVVDESQLDKIMHDRISKLTLIMYSSKMCAPCKQFKPKFVDLAKINKDVYFVYVDASNYKTIENKYFQTCKVTPMFLYYFNNTECARIVGPNEPVIISFIKQLEEKIEAKRVQLQLEKQQLEIPKPIFKNPDTELMEKKILLLNKLIELCNNGAKLTNNYNLDSDYEDILFEYRFQIDPVFRQHILALQKQQQVKVQVPVQPEVQQVPQVQQNDQTSNHSSPQQYNQIANNLQQSQIKEQELLKKQEEQELLKKQQQVNQIKELSGLHQKMQLQSYQKLQQLKKLHAMKEQAEKASQ